MKSNSLIRFLLIIVCCIAPQCIQNREDLFYSAVEGNQKIFENYALKNSACGSNKLPGSLALGRVKIDDAKLCFRAIELTSCPAWNTEGFTPDSCKVIGTSFR